MVASYTLRVTQPYSLALLWAVTLGLLAAQAVGLALRANIKTNKHAMRQKDKKYAEDQRAVLYYVVDMFPDIFLCNKENSKKDILMAI